MKERKEHGSEIAQLIKSQTPFLREKLSRNGIANNVLRQGKLLRVRRMTLQE